MSGTCHTSADSPTNPNQPCVLPFHFDGKLTNECLFDKKLGERWCATKVDEYQEVIEEPWNPEGKIYKPGRFHKLYLFSARKYILNIHI